MTHGVVVRYVTHPEHADENARLVEAVYDELAATDPGGLRYLTLRLDDGVTFVHVALHDGDDNPLTRSAAFAEFQRAIGERCAEAPAVTPGSLVGAYGIAASP